MDNKQLKIAMVLFTSGIDYDDRIRKEMLSIQKIDTNVSFKIFAVEDGKNREESGMSAYGIPYRIPYLKTRDKYASGTHTIAKAWDFFTSIKNDLKEFDAIWCADCETFLFVLLLSGKPIIWDHHELPFIFMRNPIMKTLFKLLERKVTVMVHANEARLNYLYEKGYISHMEKQFVLRNYPQFNEIDSAYDDAYHTFCNWLGDNKCVYLQGISDASRADIESIEAVLSIPNLRGVVVGYISNVRMQAFIDKFGEKKLMERIYFTGRVKQLKTPQYIRKCIMGLVFYKNTQPNNWYCEPNRLFQIVNNGNPVVVGANPPMKEFVEAGGFGISVETDGSDARIIAEGISDILSNYDKYKKNIKINGSTALWDSQEGIIMNIRNRI